MLCFGCICNLSLAFSSGLARSKVVTLWSTCNLLIKNSFTSFSRVISEIGNEFGIPRDKMEKLSFLLKYSNVSTLKNKKELIKSNSN